MGAGVGPLRPSLAVTRGDSIAAILGSADGDVGPQFGRGLFQRLFPLFLLFRRQNPGRQNIQLPSQKLLLLLPFFQPFSGLIPEFLNRLNT